VRGQYHAAVRVGRDALTRRLGEWRRDRATARQLQHDLRPPAPATFAAFGAGSVLVPPVRVGLAGCITIGSGVVIHEGAWFSVVEAHAGRPPRLVIGDRVRFGRNLSIACIGEITIGDDVMGSDDVFIGDCYHDYSDPSTPILDQPMSEPEAVEIGAGAYLGAGSIVLPGVRVGAGAYVGEGAVVTRDVPERSVVFGNPARAVERIAR
jgi:acetyltransferase-like isoleucine patch superfamily enzyme